MGKVNLDENSGFLTMSLVISLQLRQTPAHATTLFLAGHFSSDASIRRSTSRRSSCGMLAQQLCLNPSPTTTTAAASSSTTTLWDLDLISWIKLRIIAIQMRNSQWKCFKVQRIRVLVLVLERERVGEWFKALSVVIALIEGKFLIFFFWGWRKIVSFLVGMKGKR